MICRWLGVTAGISFVLLVADCSTTDPVTANDGSGSEVEARLVYDTARPAAHARVYLLPAEITSQAVIDSTLSDDSGAFRFDSIPQGTYVLEAYDDSIYAARYSDIEIAGGNDITRLGILTMTKSGSVRGIIRLSGNHDPRNVLVFISGGARVALPDTAGNFVFRDLPAGSYDLRVLPLLPNEYDILDTTGIIVSSGTENNIGIFTLRYHPRVDISLVSPDTVVLAYDTLRQFVTVSWTEVDSIDIGGYKIWRKAKGLFDYVCITVPAVSSDRTSFIDTTVSQDTVYTYHVTVKDTSGQFESAWSGQTTDSVRIVSAASCLDTILLNLTGDGDNVEITVLPHGSFAVAQSGSFPMVHWYAASGRPGPQWPLPGEKGARGRIYLTHDAAGNLYTVNNRSSQEVAVFRCDSMGITSFYWEAAVAEMDYIAGIAVHDTLIYLSKKQPSQILGFDTRYTGYDYNPVWAKQSGLSGLTVNPVDGSLYASRQSLIFAFASPYILDTTLTVTSTWIAREEGIVTIRNDGIVFIVGRTSRQICAYDSAGRFLGRFFAAPGCSLIGSAGFADNGTLYVIAKNNDTYEWTLFKYSTGSLY